MLTAEWFEQSALRLGFDVSTLDIGSTLLKHSHHFETNHEQSKVVSSVLNKFKTDFSPILDTGVEFFIGSGYKKDDIIDSANLVTFEFFDANDLSFVQTEPIALDPALGVYQLLNPLEPDQVMFIVGQQADESAILTEFAFTRDMLNPIKEYEKGPIKVKTRSLLETMLLQEQVASRSGHGIVQIDTTRYSEGITKGKRDGI